MRTLIALALLAGSAVAAQGQTNVTETRVGNTTFISGSIDGEPISGTEIRVGRTTFTSTRVGGRTFTATEIEVGDHTFVTSRETDPYYEEED